MYEQSHSCFKNIPGGGGGLKAKINFPSLAMTLHVNNFTIHGSEWTSVVQVLA